MDRKADVERLRVLADPGSLALPALAHVAPLAPPRPEPDRNAAIIECGEPLQRLVADVQGLPVYALEGWPGASEEMLVREGVNTRLAAAQDRLPPGFGLVVLDGWRPARLQRALYEHYYVDQEGGSALERGYVSPPDDPERPPPHGTGGAVDVTLSWDAAPLRLGTDFDEFCEAASLNALESGVGHEPERSLRRLLAHALGAAGFAPYQQEWWHFSFGDQAWATYGDHPAAIYGAIEG